MRYIRALLLVVFAGVCATLTGGASGATPLVSVAHAAPATAPAQAEPPLLPGVPAPKLSGELAMRTYSVDLYRLPGTLPAKTIQLLGLELENAIITDTLHVGIGLAGRVSIRFEPPQTGACAIRGLTLSSKRTIYMYYGPNDDPQRVLKILSHEFVHQLQNDYYGAAHPRSDNILLEGMAVWGSRDYFREPDGSYSYQRGVMDALNNGTLLPLATDLDADCRTTTRNNIYDEWASFVEYLTTIYGREQFDAVYRAGRGRAAGSANYQGVYGKSLDALEAEWLAWIKAQAAQANTNPSTPR